MAPREHALKILCAYVGARARTWDTLKHMCLLWAGERRLRLTSQPFGTWKWPEPGGWVTVLPDATEKPWLIGQNCPHGPLAHPIPGCRRVKCQISVPKELGLS